MTELVKSERDLSRSFVRAECVAELERAQDRGDDAALLAWTRRWGGALRVCLIDAKGHGESLLLSGWED